MALFDSSNAVRFTQTPSMTTTAITLLDSNGFERTAQREGDVRTFDEYGYDRFMVGEDGSRVLDGDIEAFVMDKYGMFGSDQDGARRCRSTA